jgi:hypothetical protein
MKKLKLELDALAVESFEAGAALERVGTVHGLDKTSPAPGCDSMQVCRPKLGYGSDGGSESCQVECTGSCGYTYCLDNCTYGQTVDATCLCGSVATCYPDLTCVPGC